MLSFDGGLLRLERVALLDNKAHKTEDVVAFGGGVAVSRASSS